MFAGVSFPCPPKAAVHGRLQQKGGSLLHRFVRSINKNFPMGHVPSIKNETIAFFVGFLPEGAGRERLLSNLGRRKPTPS